MIGTGNADTNTRGKGMKDQAGYEERGGLLVPKTLPQEIYNYWLNYLTPLAAMELASKAATKIGRKATIGEALYTYNAQQLPESLR